MWNSIMRLYPGGDALPVSVGGSGSEGLSYGQTDILYRGGLHIASIGDQIPSCSP